MLKHSSVLLIAIALGSVSLFAQQDPFLGTWKQNLARSEYDPVSGTPKVPNILKREATPGGGMKNTNDGVDLQGNKTHTENSYRLDGKDYPITGSPEFDMQSFRRTDGNTVVNVSKKNGAVMRMNRSTVSKDGKTNTIDSIGINAQGVAYHYVIVYEKQ